MVSTCANEHKTQIQPVQKVVLKETVCVPLCCNTDSPCEEYDHVKHAVPPTQRRDIFLLARDLAGGILKDSVDMGLQRVWRRDLWIIFSVMLVLNILIVASAISGYLSPWYQGLQRPNVSPILTGILWIVTSLLSFGALFMVWEHVRASEVPVDVRLSIYFMIGSFLATIWAGTFFQGNNIVASMWLAGATFLYYFWLMLHFAYVRLRASVFLMPLVAMYGYLFYSMIQIQSLNGIPF